MSIDTIFAKFLATTDARPQFAPDPASTQEFVQLMAGELYDDDWAQSFFTPDELQLITNAVESEYPIED